MARIRTVKPSFYKDEDLAAVHPLGRILFLGLWGLADREGRLEDRPKWIKAELLPYDKVEAEPLIQELHDRGFVVRYEAEGRRYIQVVNMVKHQTINQKEAPSEIPSATDEELEAARDRKNQVAFDPAQKSTGKPMPAQERKSSCASVQEGKGKEQEGEGTPTRTHVREVVAAEEGFDEFWGEYPPDRRTKEPSARSLWVKKKLAAKRDAVMAALARQKSSERWTKDGGKYVPDCYNYLRDARWADDPAAYFPPRASPSPGQGLTAADVRKMAELAKEIDGDEGRGVEPYFGTYGGVPTPSDLP